MEKAKEILDEVLRSGKACLPLSSLGLDELPSDIFTSVAPHFSAISVLNLDYNDLIHLPDDLGALTCLKELSVIGNQLEKLPDSIGYLERLEELHLNENCLTSLPESLVQLHRLRILNLVGNGLQKWNEEFASAFSESLSELHLDENDLNSLPQSFGLMKELQVLELGDNSLGSLPETFGELGKLEILNLSRNKLTALPQSFGDLPSLVSLDLTENKLESLPDTFKSAKGIQHLFLDKNWVKSLPAWFAELHSITDFGISDNLLQENPLPSCFGNVSGASLKTLDLAGNSISALPDSMGELKMIENLFLGSTIHELERRAFQNGNWIQTLPETFGGMANLRKLHLDENQLCELPQSFGSLENLEWIDLAQNLLVELPESFCSLSKLWFLQLSKNHLKTLPEKFGNLTGLVDLRLDNNYLTELPDSFSYLKDLQTLDLFCNRLCEIPSVLLQLKKLIRLDLDKNKLKIKTDRVPKLTGQVKYPARDPTMRDNWRGKTREDYVPPTTDVNIAKILEDVEENCDEGDSEDESSFNESALIRAMRRGLSIWKSHNGPNERESDAFSQERVSATSPVMYQPPVPSAQETLYHESTHIIFEDADETSPQLKDTISGASGVEGHLNLIGLEGTQTTESGPQNCSSDEEDWDKEIEETRAYEAYEQVVGRFKDQSQAQVQFTNQLQNLLFRYPPACQAFTTTATYNSVMYSMPSKPVLDDVRDVLVEGQFEDVDEEQ